MGTVYGATDASGYPVALKTIQPAFANDPAFLARFRRELRVCKEVSGARVAKLVAASADPPVPFLATQWVTGLDLARTVGREGPLDSQLLRAFAAALADALAEIHDARVVHRDLKPSNIILSPAGPIVIDFGISAAVEGTQLTQTGAVVGSPGWMAPEQIIGAQVGPAADVFTWAANVCFAASGESPFGTGAPAALLHRVVNAEPVIPDLPTSLAGPVRAAFSKDPSERPSPSEIVGELYPGNDGTPRARLAAHMDQVWWIRNTAAPPWHRTPRPAPRQGTPPPDPGASGTAWWAVAGAALLAILAVVVGVGIALLAL